MKRGEKLFNDASDKINGARQDQYGNPEDSFTLIAERWSQYLAVRKGLAVSLQPEDIAFMMVDLKLCRQMKQDKRDNLVDAGGYLGILDDTETDKPFTATECKERTDEYFSKHFKNKKSGETDESSGCDQCNRYAKETTFDKCPDCGDQLAGWRAAEVEELRKGYSAEDLKKVIEIIRESENDRQLAEKSKVAEKDEEGKECPRLICLRCKYEFPDIETYKSNNFCPACSEELP